MHDLHSLSNSLPTGGFLVFGLSMAKLHGAQRPAVCYEALTALRRRIGRADVEAVFLYANGLYFNSPRSAADIRPGGLMEMIAHKNALDRLMRRHGRPAPVHYIAWDSVILGFASQYTACLNTLKTHATRDPRFQDALTRDLDGREPSRANVGFLLEELVVDHLIRLQTPGIPWAPRGRDRFQLIVYPGPVMACEAYTWRERILPRRASGNPFQACVYDSDSEVLYDFDRIPGLARSAGK